MYPQARAPTTHPQRHSPLEARGPVGGWRARSRGGADDAFEQRWIVRRLRTRRQAHQQRVRWPALGPGLPNRRSTTASRTWRPSGRRRRPRTAPHRTQANQLHAGGTPPRKRQPPNSSACSSGATRITPRSSMASTNSSALAADRISARLHARAGGAWRRAWGSSGRGAVSSPRAPRAVRPAPALPSPGRPRPRSRVNGRLSGRPPAPEAQHRHGQQRQRQQRVEAHHPVPQKQRLGGGQVAGERGKHPACASGVSQGAWFRSGGVSHGAWIGSRA